MNIVKLNDGSEEIVSDEELEAAAEIYDRIMEPKPLPSTGPWRVEPDQESHGCALCIVAANGTVLARTPEVEKFDCDEQRAIDRPNANLMAAAPELLAVVRMLVDTSPGKHYKEWHKPQYILDAALSALTKAGVK